MILHASAYEYATKRRADLTRVFISLYFFTFPVIQEGPRGILSVTVIAVKNETDDPWSNTRRGCRVEMLEVGTPTKRLTAIIYTMWRHIQRITASAFLTVVLNVRPLCPTLGLCPKRLLLWLPAYSDWPPVLTDHLSCGSWNCLIIYFQHQRVFLPVPISHDSFSLSPC